MRERVRKHAFEQKSKIQEKTKNEKKKTRGRQRKK